MAGDVSLAFGRQYSECRFFFILRFYALYLIFITVDCKQKEDTLSCAHISLSHSLTVPTWIGREAQAKAPPINKREKDGKIKQ